MSSARNTREGYVAAMLFERFAICRPCRGSGADSAEKLCASCWGAGVCKRSVPRKIGRSGWKVLQSVERILREEMAKPPGPAATPGDAKGCPCGCKPPCSGNRGAGTVLR